MRIRFFAAKKNIGAGRIEYGEKDTGCKENVRNVCGASLKIAETSRFSPGI
jgi:hypothetical protein